MLAEVFGTTPWLWLNSQNTWDLYETLHDADSSQRLDAVEPLERPD